ncbi:cytochrome P450 [Streptomyces sp. BA2]|uniref:cytochrome P450 n=1 Tax=Streptomyces sp. BA2 TaxID=436595 RepID=UPI001F1DB9CB|nr:cytochrome P450 [Streptomyces sp. BA2]
MGLLEHDTEMVTMVLAGHETSTHLIGNGTAALLAHPDQLARLRENPALLPRAVQEIAGTRIARGDPVQPVLVSANFDPRRYTDPGRLHLTRQPDGQAENHVGFGHGIHCSLGATLARQEGEVALARLLDRYPDLALADGDPEQERARLPGSWRLNALRLLLGP